MVYFMAIWSILRPFGLHILWPSILWTFGILYGSLVFFPPFGML
jgi:hypothetical protein